MVIYIWPSLQWTRGADSVLGAPGLVVGRWVIGRGVCMGALRSSHRVMRMFTPRSTYKRHPPVTGTATLSADARCVQPGIACKFYTGDNTRTAARRARWECASPRSYTEWRVLPLLPRRPQREGGPGACRGALLAKPPCLVTGRETLLLSPRPEPRRPIPGG